MANDVLLAFFAQDLLKNKPHCSAVMDIKSSQAVFDAIRRWGGHPHFIPTGYPILKEKMEEYKALLGGEVSGHFVFADHYYGYDDGCHDDCYCGFGNNQV